MLESRATPRLAVAYDPDIGRSDHVSFHEVGVPAIHFFTGEHDDYHRVTDETNRIDRVGVNAVSSLVLEVTRSLGDADRWGKVF